MQFHAQTSGGHARVVTVTRVAGDMVTVDGNHPLAGEHLNFAVEVTRFGTPRRKNCRTGTCTARADTTTTIEGGFGNLPTALRDIHGCAGRAPGGN